MDIPVDLFLSQIEIGNVYYFSTNRIRSNLPHYFICICLSSGELVGLTCTTTKMETVKRHLKSIQAPECTLVPLWPDGGENGLTQECYVDCNRNYVAFTREEFRKMYEKKAIEYKGKMSCGDLTQIIIGMNASDAVTDEIKKIIPKLEDLF